MRGHTQGSATTKQEAAKTALFVNWLRKHRYLEAQTIEPARVVYLKSACCTSQSAN